MPGDRPAPIPGLFRKAFALHQAGERQAAETLYRQILALQPAHADALHLLGLIACDSQRLDEGVSLIGRAIQLHPSSALYRTNLAGVLRGVGRLTEAEAQYREALRLDSKSIEAHHGLARCLRPLGRLAEAEQHYRAVTQLAPDSVEARGNLADILMDRGEFAEAQAWYEAALSLSPDNPDLHRRLATALLYGGRPREAASSARMALAFRADLPDAWNVLGMAQSALGDHAAAFESFRVAVRIDPDDNRAAWLNLAASLSACDGVKIAWNDERYDDVSRLFDQPDISDVPLARPVFNALRQHPRIQEVLSSSQAGDVDYRQASASLSKIPLLLKALHLTPVRNTEIETLLVQLRRRLLAIALQGNSAPEGLSFFAALAQQCFLNEYVFLQSAEEAADVTRLQERIESTLGLGDTVSPEALLALASYRPLHRVRSADLLRTHDQTESMRAVIRQQVEEPLEERDLSASIPRLTAVRDDISRAVRAQYEENPYPRWTKPAMNRQAAPLATAIKQLLPHVDTTWLRSTATPEVLIAGCGTGLQVAAAASRYDRARILAIDLSLSSLSYAARKTRALGLRNIRYAQGDILELAAIDDRFDVIESTGVLHHLKDPLAGWRILASLLRPGGVMRVALYSKLARLPIARARALISDRGYTSSPPDIRRCRREILDLAARDPEMRFFERGDMYTLSDCRDLLFHVQECQFTIPEIETDLRQLGLEFMGFELPSGDVLRQFSAANPDLEHALGSLAAWHRFENQHPDTFRSMYVFWCRKPLG